MILASLTNRFSIQYVVNFLGPSLTGLPIIACFVLPKLTSASSNFAPRSDAKVGGGNLLLLGSRTSHVSAAGSAVCIYLIYRHLVLMRSSLRRAISLQSIAPLRVRTAPSVIYRQSLAKSSTAAACSAQVTMSADPHPAANVVPKDAEAVVEKKLPKLTPMEFREYNRLAEHMDQYVWSPRCGHRLEFYL